MLPRVHAAAALASRTLPPMDSSGWLSWRPQRGSHNGCRRRLATAIRWFHRPCGSRPGLARQSAGLGVVRWPEPSGGDRRRWRVGRRPGRCRRRRAHRALSGQRHLGQHAGWLQQALGDRPDRPQTPRPRMHPGQSPASVGLCRGVARSAAHRLSGEIAQVSGLRAGQAGRIFRDV